MQDTSEVELVRLAQQGDPEAFAELQTRLDRPMRHFIWRLIGAHEAEDDIIQDSLIALYLNLDRIQPPENLRPYLYRIVRNRCYDVLRKQRRYENLSLDDEPVEAWVSLVEPGEAQPEDVTHWLMLYLDVQAAMDRLPELQRQTLILYSEENLTYGEIAEAMNCSIGTVKSRLFYAKKTLRALLPAETVRLLDEELQGEAPPGGENPALPFPSKSRLKERAAREESPEPAPMAVYSEGETV